jgi:hypothetical protein
MAGAVVGLAMAAVGSAVSIVAALDRRIARRPLDWENGALVAALLLARQAATLLALEIGISRLGLVAFGCYFLAVFADVAARGAASTSSYQR